MISNYNIIITFTAGFDSSATATLFLVTSFAAALSPESLIWNVHLYRIL